MAKAEKDAEETVARAEAQKALEAKEIARKDSHLMVTTTSASIAKEEVVPVPFMWANANASNSRRQRVKVLLDKDVWRTLTAAGAKLSTMSKRGHTLLRLPYKWTMVVDMYSQC